LLRFPVPSVLKSLGEMVQDMAVGERKRQQVASAVLPPEDWGKYNNQSSDFAGFVQLFYHAGCALISAFVIHWSMKAGSTMGVVTGEVMLGFVSSFYFMGFHELIHNTAFRTKWINTAIAKVVGVFIFRGADWFWCFHWLHHRYTQDPEKDPELSGGSSDLFDPSKSVFAYMRFLTGWPFGFERLGNMVKMALGLKVDPWVIEAGMEKEVRTESAIYCMVYAALACGAALSENVRTVVVFYWLLPHIIGSGHLRFYQFAEHRACETGKYTDLDAWGASRTTSTWFFYRRLAWNMPYHIEHHTWPTVPFHLLPDVHERIKDKQPENRCLIGGGGGYIAIHRDFLHRVWNREPTTTSVEPQDDSEAPAESGKTGGAAKHLNSLGDAAVMAKLPRFTLEDVAAHNKRTDCWIVIRGTVIDVSSFLQEHPGGPDVIAGKAGKDLSKMFSMIHKEGTLESFLPDRCIVGVLAESGGGGLSEPLLSGA